MFSLVPRFAVALLLVFFSAHAALAHGAKTGPHGGPLQDAGNYHLELVVQRGELTLYVMDGDNKPVSTDGATASAIVLANKKTTRVALTPAGGNAMKGKGNLGEADNMKAVVSLTLAGQKPVRARFVIE
jgi:hypothetical protein